MILFMRKSSPYQISTAQYTLTLQKCAEEKRARVRSRLGGMLGASLAVFAGSGLQR
jgi:hypothetical protein